MRRMQPHHHQTHSRDQQMRLRSTTPRKHRDNDVSELHHDEHPCDYCGTGYYSESAMERCDCGDTTATLSPSKSRVRYDLGYD